jgi:hypothetical protein
MLLTSWSIHFQKRVFCLSSSLEVKGRRCVRPFRYEIGSLVPHFLQNVRLNLNTQDSSFRELRKHFQYASSSPRHRNAHPAYHPLSRRSRLHRFTFPLPTHLPLLSTTLLARSTLRILLLHSRLRSCILRIPAIASRILHQCLETQKWIEDEFEPSRDLRCVCDGQAREQAVCRCGGGEFIGGFDGASESEVVALCVVCEYGAERASQLAGLVGGRCG